MRRAFVAAALIAATFAGAGRAQARSLPDRLSPATRATLERTIDSARVAGLPVGPLYDKASEGVLKGAGDDQIVRAVRSLERSLADARGALGTSADPSVLTAAASALSAGVTPVDLHRLAHPSSGEPAGATLATALVTLVDLVTKHVPVAMATTSIQSLLDRRATDRQFTSLRADVDRDILAGRTPEASVIDRMRATTGPPPA
jgi:hypothetical protein